MSHNFIDEETREKRLARFGTQVKDSRAAQPKKFKFKRHHHSNKQSDPFEAGDQTSNHSDEFTQRKNRFFNSKRGNASSRKNKRKKRPLERDSTSTNPRSPKKKNKAIDWNRVAYSTLVMVGDEYIAGALVLAYSLKKVGTRAKLVVMVTPDVSEAGRAQLSVLFDDIVEVPYLEAKSYQKNWKRFTDQNMYSWIDKAFTKFNVLNLTNYEKVIQLDADMIAVQCPDELFHSPTPSGICTGVCGKEEENREKDERWHGKQVDERILHNSLKFWGIRGCLYIITPNARHFKDVKLELRGGEYGDENLRPGADEQLFTNFYWADWHHVNGKYARVSYINKTELEGDPYIIHSPTIKPWKRPTSNRWRAEKWLDISMWCEMAFMLTQEFPAESFSFDMEWIESAREELFQNASMLQMYSIMREEWVIMNDKFSNPISQQPAMMHAVPEKVIWMYWDSSTIPPLIELCKESFVTLNPEWECFIITPDTVLDFLYETDLPNTFCKIGKPAHKSDAVRVALLCRYGGVYSDASVICIKPLDDIWNVLDDETKFWGFRYEGRLKTHRERMCCWFMACRKDFYVMYRWNKEITRQMHDRCSTRGFYSDLAKCYLALGPPIIDPIVDENERIFNLRDPVQNAVIRIDDPTWILEAPTDDVLNQIFNNPVFKLFCCGGIALGWSREEILESNTYVGSALRHVVETEI